MTIIVYTEEQLNEAFDKNNEDIELGQDIIITNFYEKAFKYTLNGKNHTLIFTIDNNTKFQYWLLLSGRLINVKITGRINWTYDNYPKEMCGFLAVSNTSIPQIHHILFNDFKISIAAPLQQTSYSVIGRLTEEAGKPISIHDIQFTNCNFDIEDLTATKLFSLGENAQIERISFNATRGSVYHFIFPDINTKNVYADKIAIVDTRKDIEKKTIPTGFGYGANPSKSYNLFFNSNCQFEGKLTENNGNGYINNSPDYLSMGFTEGNGWMILEDKLQLIQFVDTFEIKGPTIIKINEKATYKITYGKILTDVTWYIDGVKIGSGETINYVFTTVGSKKIIAKNQNHENFLIVDAVDLRIEGNKHTAVNITNYYEGIYEGPTEENITWQIDGGAIQIGDSIWATFETPGNHKIIASVNTIVTQLDVVVDNIYIEYDNVVRIDDEITFTAKNGDEKIEALWYFEGEKEPIKGDSITYIWKSDGEKRVTAIIDDVNITILQKVISVKIEGINIFVNDRPHILTANGTFSEGEFDWSDGEIGYRHEKTYSAYDDKDEINLNVKYIYNDVDVIDYITLICYNSKIYLRADKESAELTESVTITSTQKGTEKPLWEKLYHKKEDDENWEELEYASSYEYKFNDTDKTTHLFKYSVNYEIQGLIEKIITIETEHRGIKIIKPVNNTKIYKNFTVEFQAESFGIKKPIFKWSTGQTGQNIEYTFTESGNKTITVTCEDSDRKTYEDVINLVIWEWDDIAVTIPKVFYPQKPIYYKVESITQNSIQYALWFFEDVGLEQLEGYYTFQKEYKKGDKTTVGLHVDFIDDLNNRVTRNKNYEIEAVIPTVTIIKPPKNINIFVNTLVDLACETTHITNPSFQWSTGDKTKECKHIFKNVGKQTITVECDADEGVYTDSITINVINYPTLLIDHPDYFINKVPVQFTDNSPYLSSILWKFSNGTLDYGTEITKTFNDYKDGELIECEVTGTFIDDNETIIQLSVTFSIECVTPKITIVLPEKDIEIYEDFDIPFKAETKYITNPRFNWSTGEKEQEFEHKFKFGDSGEISVICECEESDYTKEVYKDSININIMKTDEINIISPESTKFINDRPVQFTADAEHEFNIVWFFPNDVEYYEKSFNHTFSGYNGGDSVTIDVMAQFIDDLGNIVVAQKTITLICIEPNVAILTPIDGSRIYTDFDVTFEAKSNYITNPHFSWSISDDKEPIMKRRFANGGTYNISVTCEGDEGVFTNSITIYVMERDVVNIIAPSIFQNNVPVKFIAEHNHPCVTSWEFPNEEYDTGYEVEHIFTGYKYGNVVIVTLYATFEDDLKNTFVAKKSIELLCSEFVCSFYENSKGKRFYFDKSCKILQQGMTGFSEIQLATTTFVTKEYNIINGINCIDRQITFNVLIPYEGRKETSEDIKKLLAKIHAKKRELIHELTPAKELGTFYYVRDDGQVFSLKCNIALGYPIFQDETSINGWFGTISFIAPNGYWEGEEITEKSDKINNLGDIPCGFKAKLTGNLINETNESGIYALSDKSLNGYQVDTSEGLIIDDNGNNAWKDVNVNSTLVKLEIGKNIITGCDEITYKPRYIGV